MKIETPCIIVDYEKMLANINRMQALCRRHGCKLRPHIKTHKSVEIARLQMAAGASGITCAKLSEAEVMAAGGLDDIFIAYPLIGENKTERAAALAGQCKRLILAADSYACARGLSAAAVRHGITFEIRFEIDTGARRTGVPAAAAAELARAAASLPGLRLTGLFTFKGMLYENAPTVDYQSAALEECNLLSAAGNELRKCGIPVEDLSAGSTPTGPACAATGLVNEVRPGTYVFYDQMNLLQGVCAPEDVAATLRATVVSVRGDAPAYAVIDGGSKTFPTDAPLNKAPLYFHSYAYIQGRPDLRLNRLSEEHGIITAEDGGPTGLAVGETISLFPAHICTAVNLQNYVYIRENEKPLRKLPVDARGMVV